MLENDMYLWRYQVIKLSPNGLGETFSFLLRCITIHKDFQSMCYNLQANLILVGVPSGHPWGTILDLNLSNITLCLSLSNGEKRYL